MMNTKQQRELVTSSESAEVQALCAIARQQLDAAAAYSAQVYADAVESGVDAQLIFEETGELT